MALDCNSMKGLLSFKIINMQSLYHVQGHGELTGKTEIQLLASNSKLGEIEKELKWQIQEKMEEIEKIIMNNAILKSEKYQERIKEEEEKLLALFPRRIWCKRVPNKYLGESEIYPWYQVFTTKGPITIGWRKRVIHIDWSEMDNPIKSDILFKEEDVTKSNYLIHAWGYEKAKEYITKILN